MSSSSSSGRDIRRSISWACSVAELAPPVTTIRKTMKMAPKTPPAMTISIGLLALAAIAEELGVEPEAGRFDPLRVDRADPGRAILADHLARVIDAAAHELEQVLHHHDVAFHAGKLGDPHAFTGTVGEPADVHDDIECGSDLLAHRALWNRVTGQQHHHLEPAHRFARTVGVDGRDRAVMAGRHRLQHVDDLGAADFADDDPVGTHTQGVLDQVTLADLALAFDV